MKEGRIYKVINHINNTKMKKVLIAIVNNRPELNVQFVKSLLELIFYTGENGFEIYPAFYDYYDPAEMRNTASDEAKKFDVDYVFYMDADMVYPRDSIIRLAKHDVDIVGGMYNTRKLPTLPVHFKKLEFTKDFGLAPNRDYKPNTGLQEQEAGGFGGVLVKREVLNKMKNPYFKIISFDGGFYGEDVYFFEQALKLGFKGYVDTDLDYGHIINGAVYSDGSVKLV